MSPKFSRLRRRSVAIVLAGSALGLFAGSAVQAAPAGSSVGVEGLVARDSNVGNILVSGALRSVKWCTPLRNGEPRVDSFAISAVFHRGFPAFTVSASLCQASWFGPSQGVVPLTTRGQVQLEVISGPETWVNSPRTPLGWQDSQYFKYAYPGTYSVRAKVWSDASTSVAYSEPLIVTITGEPLDTETSGICTRSDVGLVKLGSEFRGGLGAPPRVLANATLCGTTMLDGPRSIVTDEGGDGSCLTMTLVETGEIMPVERSGSSVALPSTVWDAFASGSWTFQTTCSSPNWDGVPATVTVEK
jgi:hypothetical protein